MSMHSSRSASHVKRTHSLSSSRYLTQILLKSSKLNRFRISCCRSRNPMFGKMVKRIVSSPNVALALNAPPPFERQLLVTGKVGKVSRKGCSVRVLLLLDLSRS
uniref:Uncharacterized protein n=1 Tax=Opuntia streptacantha TaxID=393608 RepID=A0A7C8Z844_OPUST